VPSKLAEVVILLTWNQELLDLNRSWITLLSWLMIVVVILNAARISWRHLGPPSLPFTYFRTRCQSVTRRRTRAVCRADSFVACSVSRWRVMISFYHRVDTAVFPAVMYHVSACPTPLCSMTVSGPASRVSDSFRQLFQDSTVSDGIGRIWNGTTVVDAVAWR